MPTVRRAQADYIISDQSLARRAGIYNIFARY
jgi:hypothetical protein